MAPVYKFSNVGGFTSNTFYTSILAGNPKFEPDNGSMFPLGEFTLASAQANIDFTNIPQNYTHLQLRIMCKSTYASASTSFAYPVRFNNNSDTAYTSHRLRGDGSTASSSGSAAGAQASFGDYPTATTSNIFYAGIIDILDYTNTNKNKTVRILEGYDANGSGQVNLRSFAWLNTTAINRITITDGYANFATNSHFALYGVLA